MPCETCGCIIMDYMRDVGIVENYQKVIDDLYKQNSVPKDLVDNLKFRRDELLEEVLNFLARYNHDLRRELFQLTGTLRSGEEGEENAIASMMKSK